MGSLLFSRGRATHFTRVQTLQSVIGITICMMIVALLFVLFWFRCAWSDGVSFFTGRTSVGFIPVIFWGTHAHACSYTRSDLAISTGFLALFTLACSRAFDSNPNKQRFLAIYFTYFSGVWPARLLRHRYPDRQRRVHSSTFSVTKKWCGDLFR